ncbi:TPA: DsbA family protein [Escherichia coli]
MMFRQLVFLLFCGLGIACMPQSRAATPAEGKDYSVLKTPVADAPAVVEFFSFYCPPCGAFAERYHVSKAINKQLPAGQQVEKIHVTLLGALGYELTKAWSVAKVLGVEDKLERPLFVAVQVQRRINTAEDIRQVFIDSGVPGMVFDNTLASSEVQRITEQQVELAKKFAVTKTPSFYVLGRYLVLNNGVEPRTEDGFGEGFAQVVKALLMLPH